MLAAADTFRAAAIEQLAIWSERLGVEMIRGQYNGDPAALCYDAYTAAAKKDVEFLVCDTAGRLHNRANLMAELGKIKRILGRHDPDAPHERLLVVDATTGSNAVLQAKEFHAAVGSDRGDRHQARRQRQGRRARCHPERTGHSHALHRHRRNARRLRTLRPRALRRARALTPPPMTLTGTLPTTKLQRIDRWLGVPVCWLCTRARRLLGRPTPSAGMPAGGRILFIKLAEQGSTVLAQAAIRRAVEMVGRENVFFVVFAENRFILDLLDLIPMANVFTINAGSIGTLVTSTWEALGRIRRMAFDAADRPRVFCPDVRRVLLRHRRAPPGGLPHVLRRGAVPGRT